MSTRFEDDLRAAMVGATPPPLTLDPEAVLRQGKQTVRARRVVRASIVGLVAIAVAAFGLAGSHRDEVHPRPATPAPTPTLSTPSAPTGPVPVTLRLGSETYQVEVDLSAIAEGSGTTVTVFRGDGAQRVELFGWGTGQRPMLNPAEDGRRDVREVIGAGPTGYSAPRPFFYPGYRTTWQVVQVPVPDTGFTAYGIRFASPDDLRHVIGYDFTSPDGTTLIDGAPNGDGGWFTLLDGDDALVWANPSRTRMYLHVSGATWSVSLPRDGRAHVDDATTTDPGHVHHLVYGLLPHGVAKVQRLGYTLVPKASALGDVLLRDFGPDGGVSFVLELSSVDTEATRQVTSISWTTSDGHTVRQNVG